MSDESVSPVRAAAQSSEGSSAWSRFAFESALIVLSILLAFVLNEWREERRDRSRVVEATSRIAAEVTHNMAALDSAIPYHESVVARIAALLDSTGVAAVRQRLDAPPSLEMLAGVAPEGLRPPDLRSAAWRSSEVGGVLTLFDADALQGIAAAYQAQSDGVSATVGRLSSGIFAPERFSQPSHLLLRFLQAEIGNLVGQERFHRATLNALRDSLAT